MSQLMGMDADAVRNSATRLDGEAARLTSIIAAIDNNVGHAEQVWRGHDLEQFVGWWRTQHRPALLKAHESIAGLARSLVNNAVDQQRTSSSPGMGVAGAGAAAVAAGASAAAAGTVGRTSPVLVEGPGHFQNSKIAEAGLAEAKAHTKYRAVDPVTGNTNGEPGQCVMAVKRWIGAAGGTMKGGSGPIAAFEASGAAKVGSFADVHAGDVVQLSGKTDASWEYQHIHTFVITGPGSHPGTYNIVQSNSPAGSGLVTTVQDWKPAAPADGQYSIWRFGQV